MVGSRSRVTVAERVSETERAGTEGAVEQKLDPTRFRSILWGECADYRGRRGNGQGKAAGMPGFFFAHLSLSGDLRVE